MPIGAWIASNRYEGKIFLDDQQSFIQVAIVVVNKTFSEQKVLQGKATYIRKSILDRRLVGYPDMDDKAVHCCMENYYKTWFEDEGKLMRHKFLNPHSVEFKEEESRNERSFIFKDVNQYRGHYNTDLKGVGTSIADLRKEMTSNYKEVISKVKDLMEVQSQSLLQMIDLDIMTRKHNAENDTTQSEEEDEEEY